MKHVILKTIFLVLLLTSCQNVTDTTGLRYQSELDQDKNTLLSLTEDYASLSEDAPFSSRLAYSKGTSGYLYTFEISDVSKELSQVRVLLSCAVKDSVLTPFFGYDKDYSLVPKSKETNRENNAYHYFFINFSSLEKFEKCNVLYHDKETTLTYSLFSETIEE